jgi:molybdenum cofactor cytidylyltransferase
MSAPRGAAALVLAAGGARRFGADKLAADLDGRALLAHVLETVRAVPLEPCLVVVGPTGAATAIVERFAAASPIVRGVLHTVVNPEAERGLSTSLRVGIEELSSDRYHEVREAVVLLGDQPGIDPELVAGLIGTSRALDVPVRARYQDGPGHPVVLPRATWPTVLHHLAAAGGAAQDQGVRAFAELVGIRDVDIARPSPRDVDVPGDLDALREHRRGPDASAGPGPGADQPAGRSSPAAAPGVSAGGSGSSETIAS